MRTPYDESFSIYCETHENCKAIGICIVCSKPVCSLCSVDVGEKKFCSDPTHQIIFKDWQLLFRADSEFEADAITCNLSQCGIQANYFSLHEYPVCSELQENRTLLFVVKSEFERAEKLLKEIHLID